MKDTTSGVIKKTIDDLFEEVNNLSNDIQSYNPEFMLRSWFANPNHRNMIMHPVVNDLFLMLDEELLIGEKPESFWEDHPLSGIMGTILYGSGDYNGF